MDWTRAFGPSRRKKLHVEYLVGVACYSQSGDSRCHRHDVARGRQYEEKTKVDEIEPRDEALFDSVGFID